MEGKIDLYDIAALVAKNVSDALLKNLKDTPDGFMIMHEMFSQLLHSSLQEEVAQNNEYGHYPNEEMERMLRKNFYNYLRKASIMMDSKSAARRHSY